MTIQCARITRPGTVYPRAGGGGEPRAAGSSCSCLQSSSVLLANIGDFCSNYLRLTGPECSRSLRTCSHYVRRTCNHRLVLTVVANEISQIGMQASRRAAPSSAVRSGSSLPFRKRRISAGGASNRSAKALGVYARLPGVIGRFVPKEVPRSVGSNGETALRLKDERAFEAGVRTFNRRCRLF